MSDEKKSDDKKVEDKKPAPKKEPEVKLIRAVYGRMVDPHTGLEYTQTPSELLKSTSWVEAQIQAKKLELV